MDKKVRVRYAPSPTGHLHIGGARSALFNYLFAKHYNGDFIFRLEDTDIARNIEGGEASQLDNLRWLGIIPDEAPDKPGIHGPYRQMERLDTYTKFCNELLESGHAYECYCTSEELDADRELQIAQGHQSYRYNRKCVHLTEQERQAKRDQGLVPAIRFKVDLDTTYEWEDLVRGHVAFEGKDISDWVIMKQNGIPTYNFAVVCDDHLMEITHVFRGEEHTSNTPKQLMIYKALGWDTPQFGHMTLIVNEDRKKLSKRDETIMQFVSQYKEEGYLPEAMFNFFALLGWSPAQEKEIYTKDELIAIFDEKRLSKSPSMFDKSKLIWVNNQYIKNLPLEEVVSLAKPFLASAYDLSQKDENWITDLVALYKDQMSFGKEIIELTKTFFEEVELDEESKEFMSQEGISTTLQAFKAKVEALETFDQASIKQAIKEVQKETGSKGKMLFMPIRIATTNVMHGPDLVSSMLLIGKETVINRLSNF